MCVSQFSCIFLAVGYEMDMYDREKEFGAFLAEKFSSNDRGTSGVVYKDFGDKIKTAIKDPSAVDKNLRFFVKKKGFQILNIPSLGARDVLVVPAKEQVLLTKLFVSCTQLLMRVVAIHRTKCKVVVFLQLLA